MPIASGFSIQRNDIVDVAHRTQKEKHAAISGLSTYLLKSKPDFIDKEWEWEIRLGEVRINLDRTLGNNIVGTPAAITGAVTETTLWRDDEYTEGSTAAGEGGVKYTAAVGEFGALIFSDFSKPETGEFIEVNYLEHIDKFTGNKGGLFYQLAHDMCIHPFDYPELFKASFAAPTADIKTSFSVFTNEDRVSDIDATAQAIIGVSATTPGTTDVVSLMTNQLSTPYNFDVEGDGSFAPQRNANQLWKCVREHTVKNDPADFSTTFAAINPTDSATWMSLSTDFPLVEQDLGSGEYRVAIDGRVIADDDWIVTSDLTTRKAAFLLRRDPTIAPLSWVSDMTRVVVTISYHWKESLDVRYGALVGPAGLGPDQENLGSNAADLSWPQTDGTSVNYWAFSKPVLNDNLAGRPATNAFIGWFHEVDSTTGTVRPSILADGAGQDSASGPLSAAALTALATGGLAKTNLVKVTEQDLFYVSFDESDAFAVPFKLIYPEPTSTTQQGTRNALRRITNKFLVESDKGVDLLSDSNLGFGGSNQSPSSARKPQKWRMRFEWDAADFSIKVNCATAYQLKDDMTITEAQGRDGIKQAVYRQPGELCDIYKSPSIGRGSTLKLLTSKSNFMRRTQLQDEQAQSYPLSYRMTVTDHGLGLFMFDAGAVDQDDDYAWLVVQRHVDQTSGQPEYTDKSPVHCIYSPAKRPVDVSDLSTYFASTDLDDLSKPPALQNSLGTIFKTEGPTIYIKKDLFNGYINAVDFNSFGYASGLSGSLTSTVDIATDNLRGITSVRNTDTRELWKEKTWILQADMDTAAPNKLSTLVLNETIRVGMFIANDTTPFTLGGRIKYINDVNGQIIVATYGDLAAGLIGATNVAIGTSGTGDVFGGSFVQNGALLLSIADVPGQVAGTTAVLTAGVGDSITDLAITGFNSLPKRKNTSIAMAASVSPAALIRTGTSPNIVLEHSDRDGATFITTTPASAQWAISSDIAPSFSENVIFPAGMLERMSTFKSGSSLGGGVIGVAETISTADYTDGDSALLDILYSAQASNMEKVFESMIVALDDVEIRRDTGAYVLTYDEWVSMGDPSTVGRFLESLDAAGVTDLGAAFKVPALDATAAVVNFLGEATDGTITGIVNRCTSVPFFDSNVSASPAPSFVVSGTAIAGAPTGNLVTSKNVASHNGKLPGDIIWTNQSGIKNEYMYDFYNKNLFFKYAPRNGGSFSIKMVNYQTSNPSQETYIISTPEDRNFPETNMNMIKTVNRFVVREQDVLKPWDYHVSATMHEVDSHAIINPMEQLSITQDRNFVFSFPTQITSQRFYYPQSELDLICVSSASFSTQAGHVEINKYGDSDGINKQFDTTLQPSATDPNGVALGSVALNKYAGHHGPDGEKYIWRKNARKYEGMAATLPNGNGMRVFMQVTGSSIRYTDITAGKAPGDTDQT
jgi:hypothetical protein